MGDVSEDFSKAVRSELGRGEHEIKAFPLHGTPLR